MLRGSPAAEGPMQLSLFEQKEMDMASGQCDPDEAPLGFFAVLKAGQSPDGSNICRQCDWRRQCNDESTDLTLPGHRCMGVAVVTPDGRTIERKDGSSVVFKSRDPNFSDPYWRTA